MGVLLAKWLVWLEKLVAGVVVYPEIERDVVECAADPSKGQQDIWTMRTTRSGGRCSISILVDKATMEAINGGRYKCSDRCLDEELV